MIEFELLGVNKQAGTADLLIDGREAHLVIGAEYRMARQPPREIVEEGVTLITIATSSTYNNDFTPVDGKVKFFLDEFDFCWVKFRTKRQEQAYDRVYPRDRVVSVLYSKSDA